MVVDASAPNQPANQPNAPANCVMFVARFGQEEDGKVEWTFNVALLKDVELKHIYMAQKELDDVEEWDAFDLHTAGFLFYDYFSWQNRKFFHEDDAKLAEVGRAESKIFFSSTDTFPDHLFDGTIAVVKTYTTSYHTED